MVGEDVDVTIVEVRGNKVRLGITAPRFIPIHRREVYEAIQREKAAGTVRLALSHPGARGQRDDASVWSR